MVILAGCGEQRDDNVKIAVTTSMLGCIVKELGKEKVNVVTIVPAGMCPGHFDLKPKDAQALSDAKLLLCHGFEQFVDDIKESAGELKIITVKIEGSWMVPEIHLQAVEKVSTILAEYFPKDAAFFSQNAQRYSETVKRAASEIKEEAIQHGLSKVSVLANEMQSNLLEWFGCNVVKTYRRPEEMSAKTVMELIDAGKQSSVRLVVDNLQSGPEAGKNIANEIGAVHIALTNFPQNDSYIESLRQNAEKIFQAVAKVR